MPVPPDTDAPFDLEAAREKAVKRLSLPDLKDAQAALDEIERLRGLLSLAYADESVSHDYAKLTVRETYHCDRTHFKQPKHSGNKIAPYVKKVLDPSVDTMADGAVELPHVTCGSTSGRSCENPATDDHGCPYDKELGKGIKVCQCCKSCRSECAMDI